jgi:hypothetical protein
MFHVEQTFAARVPIDFPLADAPRRPFIFHNAPRGTRPPVIQPAAFNNGSTRASGLALPLAFVPRGTQTRTQESIGVGSPHFSTAPQLFHVKHLASYNLLC